MSVHDRRSLAVFGIELPLRLARDNHHVFVGFDSGYFGWHACLVGNDGDVILDFPWYDHADMSLGGRLRHAPGRKLSINRFPTTLTEEGWDDLEQGWWGQVTPVGGDVFVAETDFDAWTDGTESSGIVEARPGYLFVKGVLVTWNRVRREAYERAWQAAIDSCRGGRPSPAGRGTEVPVRDPTTGTVSRASRFAVAGPAGDAREAP